MAETDIILSQLSSVQALGTSLLYVAIVDQNSESGYLSGKVTVEELSNIVNNVINYAALNTTAKNILGAINELQAGGGGGGSSVSWNQIVQSGTKIAEITINGTTINVYAPTSGGGYTEVTGVLTAGQTTCTLQDASITSSSTIDVYTDVFGVNPTAISVTTGSVVLTFEAQASNVGVKVRVS